MSTVLDIVAALRPLLEPVGPGQAAIDDTGAAPVAEWEPNTLYTFPVANAEVPVESGPTARQDFQIDAVYVADSHEEASHQRSAATSALLDTKRAQYMDAARTNRSTAIWHHIQAAERTAPRTLQSRAIAVRFRGWRIVPA